jgi:DNA-binding NtrC family response regulator
VTEDEYCERWVIRFPQDGDTVDALLLANFTPRGLDLPRLMRHIEREILDRTFDYTEGNRQEAATLLHMKRTTLLGRSRTLFTREGDYVMFMPKVSV